MPELEYRSMTLQAVAVESRTISGVAVPYNSPSQLLNDRARPYREQFRAGAFPVVGPNVALYVQHDHSGVPLARTGANTLSFEEQPDGLRFSAELPESRMDVIEAVQRGDFAGVSIGFIALSDDWQHRGKGMPSTRVVERAHLYELSLVANPAYPGATISQGETE